MLLLDGTGGGPCLSEVVYLLINFGSKREWDGRAL